MWIEDYRMREGIELDEFAHRVNIVGRRMNPPLIGTVSDTLIYTLERSKVPRTHPRIADAIATVCRATKHQRDSIVDIKHHGTWNPEDADAVWQTRIADKKARMVVGEKPVVMVDSSGRLMKRYDSIKNAAQWGTISESAISSRCKREVASEFTEGRDYTYRFANEWDKMTTIERLKDLGVVVDG